jgi:hypothetical protein
MGALLSADGNEAAMQANLKEAQEVNLMSMRINASTAHYHSLCVQMVPQL